MVRLVLLGLVAIITAPGEAWAWGRVAHRAASELAARHLTAEAASAVRELLEPGERLADAALWADEHRRDVPGSSAWHYVNVPLGEPEYDPRFCPEGACVVRKIAELCELLASTSAARSDKQRALRFIVHLVEDLHQPTHVGDRDDRGGNHLPVVFLGRHTNLHRVWDEEIIEAHSTDEALWLAELERLATPAETRQWVTGTVERWATESLVAARSAYRAIDGSPLRADAQIGQAYISLRLPVARRRLAQAGVRLAFILNDVFGERVGRARDPGVADRRARRSFVAEPMTKDPLPRADPR